MDTSKLAYAQIEREELLAHLLLVVYKIVCDHGPCSQSEAWKYLSDDGEIRMRHSIGPRFVQLERKGVIEFVGTRKCRITGREVNIYASTGKLPAKERRTKPPVYYAVWAEGYKPVLSKKKSIAQNNKAAWLREGIDAAEVWQVQFQRLRDPLRSS